MIHRAHVKRFVAILAIVVVSGVSLGSSAAAADREIPRTIPPRLLRAGSDGLFPRNKDREAMLVVNVRVEPDGTASRIRVVDGFYSAAYVVAAERYVAQMRFAPATRDGQPIASNYTFRVHFNLDQTPGLRRSLAPAFVEAAEEAKRLIAIDDIPAARAQVEHMVANEVVSVFEYRVMQALLAESFEKSGQPLEAASFCEMASTMESGPAPAYSPGARVRRLKREDFALAEPLLTETLRRCFRLQAQLGQSAQALSTYAELQGLGVLTPSDPEHDAARTQELRLQDPGPLVARSVIAWSGTAYHQPFRRVFAVRGVRRGSLQGIQVLCAKDQRELEWAEGRSWRIPAQWKDCRVGLAGDAGTEFELVESDTDLDRTLLVN